jgi:hypothetical protein
MKCAFCGGHAVLGRLAVNGRFLLLASVEWEPQGAGLRGARKILSPGPLGLRSRPAYRCETCDGIMLPPATAR